MSEWRDPVIELYKEGVDTTLLDDNLRLTPDERVRRMIAARGFMEKLRAAMQEHKRAQRPPG